MASGAIMKIERSDIIRDLCIITPCIFYDFRGEFTETWNVQDGAYLDEEGKPLTFVQDGMSVSRKNTLRGMHGDRKTWKLMQCMQGSVYFVAVDVRPDSASYGRALTLNLNDKNRQRVLVPAGCANGHLCMSDSCIFHYKQTTFYQDQKQFTLRYDAVASVFWPVQAPNLVLSPRDLQGASLAAIKDNWSNY